MAAGIVTVLDLALPKISGVIALGSDQLKVALCGDGQALTASFAGGSGDARYADLTDELPNGAGYTTGGFDLTGVTWDEAGGVATLDADDLTVADLTATVKYAVIYDDDAANKDILGFFDLDTGTPAGVPVAGGDLVLGWNANGLFTLARA